MKGPSKKRLAFVSPLALQASGGGSFAVNWHAFQQMQCYFDALYAGPVRMRPPVFQTYVSKVRRRLLNLPGTFAFFSPAALQRSASDVERRVPGGVDALLFRSAAPFALCRPRVPYFVYLDVVFHTFFHNTFEPSLFIATDLKRIWAAEAAFLERATGVFFESRWGLDCAREAYSLKGDHFTSPGRGGVIGPPDLDSWDGSSFRLLTMAMKFRQKGGDLVLAAYRSLKARFPRLGWDIIGGPPEGEWQSADGIIYHGEMRPDNPVDRDRLRHLLANAFLLVHPTREDTNPLVLTEAAYFGCPSVTVNRFAIPELVVSGRSGLLLEPPVASSDVAAAIERLLTDKAVYLAMRREARAHALKNSSWEQIGRYMAEQILHRTAVIE